MYEIYDELIPNGCAKILFSVLSDMTTTTCGDLRIINLTNNDPETTKILDCELSKIREEWEMPYRKKIKSFNEEEKKEVFPEIVIEKNIRITNNRNKIEKVKIKGVRNKLYSENVDVIGKIKIVIKY